MPIQYDQPTLRKLDDKITLTNTQSMDPVSRDQFNARNQVANQRSAREEAMFRAFGNEMYDPYFNLNSKEAMSKTPWGRRAWQLMTGTDTASVNERALDQPLLWHHPWARTRRELGSYENMLKQGYSPMANPMNRPGHPAMVPQPTTDRYNTALAWRPPTLRLF